MLYFSFGFFFLLSFFNSKELVLKRLFLLPFPDKAAESLGLGKTWELPGISRAL